MLWVIWFAGALYVTGINVQVEENKNRGLGLGEVFLLFVLNLIYWPFGLGCHHANQPVKKLNKKDQS